MARGSRIKYGYLTHLRRLLSEQRVRAQATKERYPTAFDLVIRYSRPTTNWVVPLYSPEPGGILSFLQELKDGIPMI